MSNGIPHTKSWLANDIPSSRHYFRASSLFHFQRSSCLRRRETINSCQKWQRLFKPLWHAPLGGRCHALLPSQEPLMKRRICQVLILWHVTFALTVSSSRERVNPILVTPEANNTKSVTLRKKREFWCGLFREEESLSVRPSAYLCISGWSKQLRQCAMSSRNGTKTKEKERDPLPHSNRASESIFSPFFFSYFFFSLSHLFPSPNSVRHFPAPEWPSQQGCQCLQDTFTFHFSKTFKF